MTDDKSEWVLVPREITREMQSAYFAVIDKNMARVTTDATFGRHDSQEEAYRAMIAAAPAPAPVEPVVPEDTVWEAKCHYCGDMSWDAHSCRSGGGHDWRSTGRKVSIYPESPLYTSPPTPTRVAGYQQGLEDAAKIADEHVGSGRRSAEQASNDIAQITWNSCAAEASVLATAIRALKERT